MPAAAAAALTSPAEQQEGDDGTKDTGDLLLPHRIFCPSDISTPSSISTALRIDSTLDVDLHQPRQSARVHRQIAEDPNQPYMDCATPLQDVNLYHAKEEKD